MKACERDTFLIKGMQKGCFFFQNGLQKGNGLNLGAELTCITVCRVSPGHNVKFNYVFQDIFL